MHLSLPRPIRDFGLVSGVGESLAGEAEFVIGGIRDGET